MLPIISERQGDRVKIEVTVDLSGSMLDAEEAILRAVNAVGNVATGEALKRFDAAGDPIVVGGAKWYSKGKLPKIYNTPYGVVSVERHVYQPAEGGKTFCPMDDGARIIRKATPRFAKIVSHKFARGAATQVMEDLEQNHGRRCLKASLQDLAAHVGTVVQAKEESWSYATPEVGRVATVGIGVDGTCMLICDHNWREAKTLVKQRLCCSGMRWTPEGAQIVLSLRALALTPSRWEQFWQKINRYGVPEFPYI